MIDTRPWLDQARCAGHPNPEWWDAPPRDERGELIPDANRTYVLTQALDICEFCPVRDQCLADADLADLESIRGGVRVTRRHIGARPNQRPWQTPRASTDAA